MGGCEVEGVCREIFREGSARRVEFVARDWYGIMPGIMELRRVAKNYAKPFV